MSNSFLHGGGVINGALLGKIETTICATAAQNKGKLLIRWQLGMPSDMLAVARSATLGDASNHLSIQQLHTIHVIKMRSLTTRLRFKSCSYSTRSFPFESMAAMHPRGNSRGENTHNRGGMRAVRPTTARTLNALD